MATVRVWDDEWNLLATIEQGWRADEPMTVTVDNTTDWIHQFLLHPSRMLHLTVEIAGRRRSGRFDTLRFYPGDDGYVKVDFTEEHLPTLTYPPTEAAFYGQLAKGALEAMKFPARH